MKKLLLVLALIPMLIGCEDKKDTSGNYINKGDVEIYYNVIHYFDTSKYRYTIIYDYNGENMKLWTIQSGDTLVLFNIRAYMAKEHDNVLYKRNREFYIGTYVWAS